jgi:hypothetical protein
MDQITCKNVPGTFSVSSTLARRDYDGTGKGQLDRIRIGVLPRPSALHRSIVMAVHNLQHLHDNREAQVRTRTGGKESLQIQTMLLLPVLVSCLEAS